MTSSAARPSRLSLISAALAVLLGIAAVIAHLQQPKLPSLPGRGCLVTGFQSPDTRYIPAPRVDFEACIHISETLFYLWYYGAPDDGSGLLFEASGPEGPEQWNQHFRINWRTPDTLELGYDGTIQVMHSVKDTKGLHIVFSRY